VITTLRRRPSPRLPRLVFPACASATALAVGAALATSGTARVAIAASSGLTLVVLAARQPVAATYALVVWLAVLGTVRRVTTGIGSAYASGDPFLLIGPAVIATLALIAFQRGVLRQRTPLTYAVLLLMSALGVAALNPEQGDVTVGLGGVLLVVVPMMAFFVGRSFVSDTVLRRVLGLYAGLAVVAAVYGLFQTFVRLPSWDQRWVEDSGYTALSIGGVTRAFGPFASGSEYAIFLAIGVVSWVTLGAAGRWRGVLVPASGILIAAIWYESARAAVVLLVVALGLMLAARLGLSLWRSLLLGVLLLAALPWVVGRLAPDRFGSDPGSKLASHQVAGLTDPFGAESTLPGHITLVQDGLRSAVRNPLGHGIGSVTIAAAKLGGSGGSAEVDPANAALAAGAFGFVAYLATVVLGLGRSFQRARFTRRPLDLAVLGVLLATFLQWLNGGQYAVAVMPWLVLGWLDQPSATTDDRRTNARSTVETPGTLHG
jgi:hypothetical protein